MGVSIINYYNNMTMLIKSMKKQLNKLLQKKVEDIPSTHQGGQLPKIDKKNLVIIHIEE